MTTQISAASDEIGTINQERRRLLTTAAFGIGAAGATSLLAGAPAIADTQSTATPVDTSDKIRPFHVHVPQAVIDDLRRRLKMTRWPDKETVSDGSQGIRLENLKPLVAHWAGAYDWRKAEAKLNSLPQFKSYIDGVDIHFIHVRSTHANALPLLITHGWPGSVFEQMKVIGPLTDPTAHGGRAEDAFDVVIPSMPGYGFSSIPAETGWGPERIARAWAQLMTRLGYSRYVAQGGDWGSPITSAMARQQAPGLVGIHINLPATVPPEIGKQLVEGGPAPAGLSPEERKAFDTLTAFTKHGDRSYATVMGTRPQTIGYGITDSPAGLAAWLLGHPGFAHWTYSNQDAEKPLDDVLDDITLYWVTNTATSSARLYWETGGAGIIFAAAQKTQDIALPVAITVFPDEIYEAPESWARRAYRNLSYFHAVDKGGHFAAWEEPALFSQELRAAFRPLRQAS